MTEAKFRRSTKEPGNLWSVVLAGGEGERIRPFIKQWLGQDRPKQYCTFVGTRSLFQHTVDRADALSSPERRIVVAAKHHAPYVREQMRGRAGGRVLFQPHNRGTAPGIFLPLTYVLAWDPDARVVIYPSDHFVYPEDRFMRVVADALAVSEELNEGTILLGAKPNDSVGDYGWVRPGIEIGRTKRGSVFTVHRFIEKPAEDAIPSLTDAYWNTFVIVGQVRSLWALGWRYVPEVMPLFIELWDSVDRPGEPEVLEKIYETMPESDFSGQVLEPGVGHLAMMSLDGVYWSDWGRGERVMETLDRLGIEAPFAVA